MAVIVTSSTLKDIRNSLDLFKGEFTKYAQDVSFEARLLPVFSEYRISDAHLFWTEDLVRVERAEPDLENGLDHFKQCGHLAYWLRRMSPVIEFSDASGAYSEGASPLDKERLKFRELLYKYGMEYLAFDWAFQICRFHEKTRPDKSLRADAIQISPDYAQTICHFLKRKNVSPHALFLIYKSLFQ
ncbi:conserved hypothetical protein [Azospirillaceae bacterium]